MIRVRYGKIHVGALQNESGIHVGNNFVGSRTHYGKSSEAIGSVVGRENKVFEGRMVVVDDDIVDGGRVQQRDGPHSES